MSGNAKLGGMKLGLESLESREVPALWAGPPAYTNLVNGVLQVVGDSGHNAATVDQAGAEVRVRITSTGSSAVVNRTFPRADVREIRFWGYDGNDRFVSNVNIPSTAWGGNNNDYLEGANAVDVFYGGDGNDTLVGYGGNDRLYGDAGNDRLVGMSGDDLLVAGLGTDSLDGGSGFDIAWMSQARSTTTNCEQVNIALPGGNPQRDDWSCGPNSAWRVMQAHGGSATYQDLKGSVRRNSIIAYWRFGTTTATLVGAMNSNTRGLGSYRFGSESGASINRIVDLLREGRPVIALVRAGNNLHWVAVDGFDSNRQMLFYTETNGARYEESYGSFQSRMNWDFGWAANSVLRGAGVVRNTIIA
jgi:hypothetical protein